MGDWDVETKLTPMTNEQHRALRHHPAVVAQLAAFAEKVVGAVGHPNDFGVLVQNDPSTQRARAFAKPTTKQGIHLELTESVLIKAAGSSGNHEIESAPPAGLMSVAERQGDTDLDSNGQIKAT